MQLVIRISFIATLTFVLTACDGPFIFTAGGELSGSVVEPPDTWVLAEDSALAQLETRPEDPYSINLVYVQIDGHLYVYAGNTQTEWVQHIEQNPQVRIRINENIYPMRAIRVYDNDEFIAFADLWASRSMFQRDPKQFDEVWLYRLERREPTPAL